MVYPGTAPGQSASGNYISFSGKIFLVLEFSLAAQTGKSYGATSPGRFQISGQPLLLPVLYSDEFMAARLRRFAGQLLRLCLANGLFVFVASPVAAQDLSRTGPSAGPDTSPAVTLPFFVRLGAGSVSYNTSGTATTHGDRIADARVAFDRHAVGTIEGGWRVSPEWSLSVLGGIPPTVSLQGQGAFERLGELRKVTYGSVLAGVQYHPFGPGRVDPYIGGGLGYSFVFQTRGGSLSELRIADSFGTVLQVGADVRLTDRLSLYVDARKIWLSFDAKGVAPTASGPSPVHVEVQPNPVVGTIGLSYRF
jgi:outer membrane protein